jgi:hypothetical protein
MVAELGKFQTQKATTALVQFLERPEDLDDDGSGCNSKPSNNSFSAISRDPKIDSDGGCKFQLLQQEKALLKF